MSEDKVIPADDDLDLFPDSEGVGDYTPKPWFVYPRSVSNDGSRDEMSGLGWELVGPPAPQLRGDFAKRADALLVSQAPDMYELLDRLDSAPTWADFADVLTELPKVLERVRGETYTIPTDEELVVARARLAKHYGR